jgi:glycosyltransferase involved in cell wall biosynthesis
MNRKEGNHAMRIAQIAPLQVAVPPKSYGGTERVVHALTEGLVRLGHEVTLFATGDSCTTAQLVPMIARAVNFDPAVDITAVHVAELTEVYRQADRFDVVHSHIEHLTPPYAATTRTPTVLTMHGRLDDPRSAATFRNATNCHYVAISQSQRRALPDLDWAATIHHGVDVDAFRYYGEPGQYLAFVGRIAPEKRPDRAIEIAMRAGVPLKIAAKVDPTDAGYFQTVIQPLLAHPLIEFLGELDEVGKRDLMGHALALLLPIDWPEPFGMVFIESLACGTPVLTCPLGSVPELLRDGVTGYACDTVDACVAAVQALPRIARAGCRAYAKARFDIRQMALAYVNVYAQAQGRRRPFVDSIDPASAASEAAQIAAGHVTRDRLDQVRAPFAFRQACAAHETGATTQCITPESL